MPETVALIDYGAGNLPSVHRALDVAARAAQLSIHVAETSRPEGVRNADRIVIPGVGHFRDCAKGIAARSGLLEAIEERSRQDAQPTLGICVGMQLMATTGLEDGSTKGFGWVNGTVRSINSDGLPIPHMGWNSISIERPHPVVTGLKPNAHAYFVHSFAMEVEDASDCVATTHYGESITAIIANESCVGTQFHPEKSQATGLKLIENWLTWKP